MARILISAGHTVMDPGAIFQDLREADLTRKIAPKIIPYLEKAGVEVQAVPLDLPLWQRIEWINNTGYTDEQGDVLVEIHVNDSDGSKQGMEAWYRGKGDNNSQKLAMCLLDSLKRGGFDSQGMKSEFEHELGSLTFLNRTKPAAVLLETLYMDNPEDIKLLKSDDDLERIARGVAIGILRFFGKSEQGKDLPTHKLPKYDELKPYDGPAKSAFGGLNKLPGKASGNLPKFGGLGGTGIPGFGKPDNIPADNPGAIPSQTPFAPKTPTSNGFGAPSSPSFGAPSATEKPKSAASNLMMDRQQRKEMIEKTYMKLLGRKPSQSDLNYFLNQGITEADLIRKMFDSQEHADIIKAKEDYKKLHTEHEKLKTQLSRMKATINDQKQMLEQLNRAIMHKNQAIKQLESRFTSTVGMPSEVAANPAMRPQPGQTAKPNYKHEPTRKDKFFKFLNNRVN